MVTADEVGRVTIFTCLDAADRDRLSRAAADISLMPDEFAAHEGDDRALFAVLEGRIEAVKLEDGIPLSENQRRLIEHPFSQEVTCIGVAKAEEMAS